MTFFQSTRLLQLCLLLLLAVIFSSFAQAANFVVSNTADSGPGSLRQAILNSNSAPAGAHTMTFAVSFPANGMILLNSNLPQIRSQSLIIMGGSKQPRIDGRSQYALFNMGSANLIFELSDLHLQNALAPEHGACISSGYNAATAQLKAERVTFSNCKASGLSLIRGGAIYWSGSSGKVGLINSQFFDNSVVTTDNNGESAGGALYTTAELFVQGTLFEGNGASSTTNGGGLGGAIALLGTGSSGSITESTFRFNGASPGSARFGYGGAVYLGCDACDMQIKDSYLRGNSANYGGAVFARKTSTGTTDVYLTLSNSTFYNGSVVNQGAAVYVGNKTSLGASNNTFYNGDASAGAHLGFEGTKAEVNYFRANLLAATVMGTACTGTPTVTNPGFVGFNLFADASCASLTADALPNSPLGTVTVDEAPGLIGVLRFSGSAVIDSITSSANCEPLDARNQIRPIDGDSDGSAYCDVGAFEAEDPSIFRDGFES